MTESGSFLFYVFKYIITAMIIVGVSEAAKRSDRLGGLLAALPVVSVLTLVWLQVEHQPFEVIKNHALYTLYYVIPTLPMFLAFPWLYDRHGFTFSLVASSLLTVLCFGIFAVMVFPFGVVLIGASA
eukprot:gene5923-4236_t